MPFDFYDKMLYKSHHLRHQNTTCFTTNQVRTDQVRTPELITNFLFRVCLQFFNGLNNENKHVLCDLVSLFQNVVFFGQ